MDGLRKWTVQRAKIGRSKRMELDGLKQGSKSRKITYRAFVHDFVRRQNIFRARKKLCLRFKSCYLIIEILSKKGHNFDPY